LDTYKGYTILVQVDPIVPPLSGGQAYVGKVIRLYNLEAAQDVHPQLHIHHAKEKLEAENLSIAEARGWIDAHSTYV